MTLSIEHPTDRPNFYILHGPNWSVAFSYRTAIAYRFGWNEWIVRTNDWGPTTGKHLNYISEDHEARIPGYEFEKRYNEELVSRLDARIEEKQPTPPRADKGRKRAR